MGVNMKKTITIIVLALVVGFALATYYWADLNKRNKIIIARQHEWIGNYTQSKEMADNVYEWAVYMSTAGLISTIERTR